MKTSFLKRLTAGILSFIILMSAVNFSVFADFVIGTDGGKQKLYVSSADLLYHIAVIDSGNKCADGAVDDVGMDACAPERVSVLVAYLNISRRL